MKLATVHATAIRAAMEKAFAADPRWAPMLVDIRRRLDAGEFSMRDAITQPHGEMTLEETFAFTKVWCWLKQGLVGVCRIKVHEHPRADRFVEDNQRALDAEMPSPFAAFVQSEKGRGANGDGCLEWNETVVLDLPDIDNPRKWICPPSSVPLEIGTTCGSRTAFHIMCGGVARWPYDSDEITVFVARPGFRAKIDALAKKR